MDELDFNPNFAARALRAAKSMTITLAFFELHAEDLSDPYRNLLQGAIMQGATELGYSLLSTFVRRSGESTFPPSSSCTSRNAPMA
ncbi:MAG: LacI family transcriptional regulator [Pleurocapsa sp. SU_196_0]|nr:LacI family transcriptional regulator [Pleurocapsa sp. SU_196_0]